MTDRMTAWHRVYSPRVTPVKARLGEVIGVFRGTRQADTQALCTQLRDGAAGVLGDENVLHPPDPQVTRYLVASYQGIYRIALACLQGQDAKVRGELKKVETDLAAAGQLLARYGLRP